MFSQRRFRTIPLAFGLAHIAGAGTTVKFKGYVTFDEPLIPAGSTFTGEISYTGTEQIYDVEDQYALWRMDSGDSIKINLNGYSVDYTQGATQPGDLSVHPSESAFYMGLGDRDQGYSSTYPGLRPCSMTVQFVWLPGTLKASVLPDPFPASSVALSNTAIILGFCNSNSSSFFLQGVMSEVTAVAATTINTSPGGGVVMVDNVLYTTPQTFQWALGSQHTNSAPGVYGSQVFDHWSDCGAVVHTVAASGNQAAYTAYYSAVPPLAFFTVTPCRVADTRSWAGYPAAFGAPSLSAGTTRTFAVPASPCGIPSTAQVYSLNVTAVVPAARTLAGLKLWPADQAQPAAASMSSNDGRVVATAAIAGAGTAGAVALSATDATDVIIDINGYFAPPNANGLAFYPITPCRVSDTRVAEGFTGALGPPAFAANTSRTLPVLSSRCGIPSTAKAYSLNIAAVPPGPMGWISTWPTGQAKPAVSTLNAYDGSITANAAIVLAGTNGSIDLYASDATDVIVDINGYFAPSSLNMTVVPPGPLSWLTAWPSGGTQPTVSTLNAYDGSVVANAAIVLAGMSGSIDLFVSDKTDVVADINGYFAAPGSAGALYFYPVTSCTAVDTRTTTRITGGSTRTIPIAGSGCGVPSTAQAYSLTLTAIPPTPMNWLTVWPTGLSRPLASTLNAYRGKAVANAALMPAGNNGSVSVFVSDAADVVVDVNGYFAP